jgi:hypothetical protein
LRGGGALGFSATTLGDSGAARGAGGLGAGAGGTGVGTGTGAAGFVAAGFGAIGFVAAGFVAAGLVGDGAGDADFGAPGESHQNSPATPTTRNTTTQAVAPPRPPSDMLRSLAKSGSPLLTSVAGTVGSIPSFSRCAFSSRSRDIPYRVSAPGAPLIRNERAQR